VRDIAMVDVEVTEIENALEACKAEIAAGATAGQLSGSMIKKEGS
jgi:hypothetical protein